MKSRKIDIYSNIEKSFQVKLNSGGYMAFHMLHFNTHQFIRFISSISDSV